MNRDGSDSSVYRSRYGWWAWMRWQWRRFFGLWSSHQAHLANHMLGCVEKAYCCNGWTYIYHRYCERCDAVTCHRKLITDPITLRRRMQPLCWECDRKVDVFEAHHRLRRVRDDWEKITVPVDGTAIIADQMPEQYPARTRAAIRAFLESGSDVAVVLDVSPAALQNSIRVLGLEDTAYAEQRDNETVIRKINQEATA